MSIRKAETRNDPKAIYVVCSQLFIPQNHQLYVDVRQPVCFHHLELQDWMCISYREGGSNNVSKGQTSDAEHFGCLQPLFPCHKSWTECGLPIKHIGIAVYISILNYLIQEMVVLLWGWKVLDLTNHILCRAKNYWQEQCFLACNFAGTAEN